MAGTQQVFAACFGGSGRAMEAVSGGLLLGDAVNRPAFADDVEGIDRHDLAAVEELAEQADGGSVALFLPEDGDENGGVENEEVHVARGE